MFTSPNLTVLTQSRWLRLAVLALPALLFLLLPYISSARFQSTESSSLSKKQGLQSVPGEILVRFRDLDEFGRKEDLLLTDAGGTLNAKVERLQGPELIAGLRLARVDPYDTDRAIEAFRQRPDVIYAEPNYIRRKLSIPNDPLFPDQWSLRNTGQLGGTAGADIGAEQAWNTTTGSRDIVVAIIDEGIDVNHQDLQTNIWRNVNETPGNAVDDDGNGFVDDVNGFDFLQNNSSVYDGPGTNPDGSTIDAHGTHIAGTIGAAGNNGIGIAGVNWQASLLPLKVLGPNGGTSADILEAYAYAKMMRDRWQSSNGVQGANVRVVNNSYGGFNYSQAESDAIQILGNSGMVFVAAAGNDGADNNTAPNYPASYDLPNVISVAATDPFDNISHATNLGSVSVHLGAPGINIVSTTPGNTYTSFSGTSMAASHVSGAVALVLAAHPQFAVDRARASVLFGGQLHNFLEQTTMTGTRLSAIRALQNANEVDTTTPATIQNLQVASQEGRNISLKWTAPGDDGNSGKAALYEIRFSDQTTGAKYRLRAQRPLAAGAQESTDINIPYRHIAGTVTVLVLDNVGNKSTASINVSVNAERADPYIVSQSPATPLSTGGQLLNASFDDSLYTDLLPFSFPTFERFASQILLSTNGAIYFLPSNPRDSDLLNSASRLSSFNMVAGLWDDLDLRTSRRADGGIYFVQPNSDKVIYRWQGVPCNPDFTILQCTGGGPVNFEIELNRDGTIVIRYGSGNTALKPVVGLGGGEPDAYPIASHTSELTAKDLTNAPSVTFKLRNPPKKADLTVTLSSNPNPVMVGGNLNYLVTVTNQGPDQASSVGAGFNLPLGTQFVSCSTSVGFCSGPAPGKGGSVFAKFGRLGVGETATFTIVARAAVQESSYFSSAGASSLTYDPDMLSNPTAYVDALLQTVGLLSHPSRVTWISYLNTSNTSQRRGDVLRGLVESQQVYDKYYREAFVIMQYFGYLRRTADLSYLDWINTMNQTNGDYRIMINGFLNSAEYRKRFGP